LTRPSDETGKYHVAYSGLVRRGVVELWNRAPSESVREQFVAALRKIHRLLEVYPQFGEQLQDMSTRDQTLWIGTVPPLTLRYIIDEAHRVVFVVIPFQPLPNSGLS
jgi:hypothetical protein